MLLSIVIPTKDRYDTVLVVVNKILEIDSDKFERLVEKDLPIPENHKVIIFLSWLLVTKTIPTSINSILGISIIYDDSNEAKKALLKNAHDAFLLLSIKDFLSSIHSIQNIKTICFVNQNEFSISQMSEDEKLLFTKLKHEQKKIIKIVHALKTKKRKEKIK